MKRLLILITASLFLNACSIDDGIAYHYEILPVDSFEVPETFAFGQTYPIIVFYKRPTTCHGFQGFYYDRYLNIRTIGIQSIVVDRNDCEAIDSDSPAIKKSFDFMVTQGAPYTYIFKFYKGKDEEGNNIFEEIEIPVE